MKKTIKEFRERTRQRDNNGKRLAGLRHALGLSQPRAAALLNVPLKTYAGWEQGQGWLWQRNGGPRAAEAALRAKLTAE